MLKIEHLKKSYENFSLDCSLEVKKGHVTGLIGQNGAGKSTTFKAILGLISFDSGTINILGKSLQDFTAKDKQDLGVVLSDSGFSGYLTINDIIPIIDNLYQNFDKSFFIEVTFFVCSSYNFSKSGFLVSYQVLSMLSAKDDDIKNKIKNINLM